MSVNGKPAVRFTRTSKFVGQMLVGSQSLGAGPVTLIAVYAFATMPAGTADYGGSGIVNLGHAPGTTLEIAIDSKQGFAVYGPTFCYEPSAPALNQFRAQSVVYDKTGLQSFLNGVAVGPSKPQSPGVLGSEFVLAAHRYDYGTSLAGWEYFANSDIAEVIVYKRALTPTERLAVEGYLKFKYKLP